MNNAERKEEGRDLISYFENAHSCEEALYKLLKDHVSGKLSADDLRGISDMHLNTFPPSEFFHKRSGSWDVMREQIEASNSPEEFAQTQLCKAIMSDRKVVERFKKASPWIRKGAKHALIPVDSEGYPSYWPKEYRVEAAEGEKSGKSEESGWSSDVKQEQQRSVRDWRQELRELLFMD